MTKDRRLVKAARSVQLLGGVAVSLLLAAACGGKVRSSEQTGEAGLYEGGAGESDGGGMAPPPLDAEVEAKVDAAMEAGVDACTELDHTSEVGLCQAAESCFRSSILPRPAQPPEGVMVFNSQANLLAYFDNMAELDSLSVPAHGVDCSPGSSGACTYDPLSPALNPSDIHYSNPAQEFVGPDGHPYVWTYLADQNSWIVVDGGTSAVLYGAVADLNGCPQG